LPEEGIEPTSALRSTGFYVKKSWVIKYHRPSKFYPNAIFPILLFYIFRIPDDLRIILVLNEIETPSIVHCSKDSFNFLRFD